MRNDPTTSRYFALARPAELGALLRVGPEPLSFYWSNPSRGLHAAAIGELGGFGTIDWLGGAPVSFPPGPFFGGWAFDARRDWLGFASERWFLPEVLAWWDGRRAWLAAFGVEANADALNARLDRVTEIEPHVGATRAQAVGDRASWTTLVTNALGEIDSGAASKIVCARRIEIESDDAFDERSILKSLEARHPQCWTFLIRGTDGRAFLGSSPETLCSVRDGVFEVDALAGTAAEGQGAALLGDDKERREHAAVISGISGALDRFAVELKCPEVPSIKRLANVDHLHTVITGRLRDGIDPLEVAKALHPTPAVAGTPRGEVLDWLRVHEGFDRGWYTGAIGARTTSSVTLAVALRAALISQRTATLFVGAGIVKGSTPEREWLETERKANALLPALGVAHAH